MTALCCYMSFHGGDFSTVVLEQNIWGCFNLSADAVDALDDLGDVWRSGLRVVVAPGSFSFPQNDVDDAADERQGKSHPGQDVGEAVRFGRVSPGVMHHRVDGRAAHDEQAWRRRRTQHVQPPYSGHVASERPGKRRRPVASILITRRHLIPLPHAAQDQDWVIYVFLLICLTFSR